MLTTTKRPVPQLDRSLAAIDPELWRSIGCEALRQEAQIELIASENIVSRAVREAQGSVLTNKYAEGYPGKRYYGGCEYVDVAESLAIERVCHLILDVLGSLRDQGEVTVEVEARARSAVADLTRAFPIRE